MRLPGHLFKALKYQETHLYRHTGEAGIQSFLFFTGFRIALRLYGMTTYRWFTRPLLPRICIERQTG